MLVHATKAPGRQRRSWGVAGLAALGSSLIAPQLRLTWGLPPLGDNRCRPTPAVCPPEHPRGVLGFTPIGYVTPPAPSLRPGPWRAPQTPSGQSSHKMWGRGERYPACSDKGRACRWCGCAPRLTRTGETRWGQRAVCGTGSPSLPGRGPGYEGQERRAGGLQPSFTPALQDVLGLSCPSNGPSLP